MIDAEFHIRSVTLMIDAEFHIRSVTLMINGRIPPQVTNWELRVPFIYSVYFLPIIVMNKVFRVHIAQPLRC